ncbi:multidrug ABC transporter ATP-binding protein [Reticulibacter mediterranei]|uniref:Multidrug ABC transporter ATP-binding protein n=1 Tax=Reticulibacter mediterranei TaxID=2778369 RepID=A0A8J3INM8_9CHLR|nr:ABC transporter ATP-binding protein [Reticulibacter mediterranei]GHO94287.1 multidrug ABC transporter ATP-binding protein [Reticulibacter mediterranei]
MIKLARFLQPYKLSLAAVLLLVFLQALSDLYLPTLMADIVDIGVVKGDTPYILTMGAFMLVVAIGGAICAIGASYMSSRVATGFGKIIRAKLFSHVERFSLHEFDKFGSASLITRTTNDTTQVQQVYIIILRMMISAPLMAVGGIIMAVSKDAQLSLVLVGALPILAIAIWIITGNGIPLFQVMQKKLDKINLILDENLTGMRVIRSLNRINHEQQRFQDANQDLTDVSIKVNRIMAAMWPTMMLIMNISSIAIVWFGGLRVGVNDLQIGDLMAFLQYSTQIMFAMLMVSMMFIMIPRASASATRINEVLDVLPAMSDAEEVKQADKRRGYVEFRDVTFSYPGAERPAIKHISFNARPGEVTAIIGGTGAGKSTLVNLIPRFYDIDSGGILVDGVDVREMTQESLRAKIGLVPQKAVLFSGTVADNIRYGKDDASDEDVIHAADVAQASEFVSGMADGFDSQIAQGGTNVSGGQKQRLSIARALIRRPEIYIFDDSFSALDFKTDAKLRAALKGEIANSTVFIVAQRVSTVMDANQIIVLDEGKIAGIGTHRELMQSSNVYREIVSSQLSMEEIA